MTGTIRMLTTVNVALVAISIVLIARNVLSAEALGQMDVDLVFDNPSHLPCVIEINFTVIDPERRGSPSELADDPVGDHARHDARTREHDEFDDGGHIDGRKCVVPR